MRVAHHIGVAICILAGWVAPASACVNTFKSKILIHKSTGDQAGLAAEIARLEAAYRGDPSLTNISDFAVGKILTDKYPAAIKLLEEAEAKFPGQAIVAANMGTAYELMGDNAQALRWISEGVKRDPNEHSGTEWLHVKILEAKIALAGDPDWLKTHTVLGVSFGEGELPAMPPSLPLGANGRQRAPKKVGDAIWYQLRERTQFVRPPDPIVADLYAAYGDLAYAWGRAGNHDVFMGNPAYLYSEALRFGPVNPGRVELRERLFEAAYPDGSWGKLFENFEMK